MNEEQNPEVALEVLQPSVLGQLERAQIDTQVATAHQYPRSLDQFKKRAIAMATLDEDTAESCIYVRPVGKEQNAQGLWVEKFAEGPSIRMAEIVGAAYGNIRVQARIVEQTERFVRCEGTAHDLESNYAGKSEVVEATVNKKGQPYSERQRALTAKVCLAKAFRDAMFRVVPRALMKPAYDAARKVTEGQGHSLEKRRAKAKAWLAARKIEEPRAFAVLSVAGWEQVNDEQLLILTGLRTAIQDGDETPESAFPFIDGAQQQQTKSPVIPGTQPKQPTGPVNAHQTSREAGTSTTPTPGATSPGTPSSAQSAPKESTVTKPAETQKQADEKAEADAGLAPAQTQTPAQPPQTPNTTPADVPKAEPVEPFKPNAQESDELQNVRLMMYKNGIAEPQIMTWAIENKLARVGQKLSDLSTGKFKDMLKNWDTICPKIRAK